MTEAAPGSRSVQARAKVNLFLRILGLRPDGYHDLETLIVPISLADRVQVNAGADPSFETPSFSLEVTGDADLVGGVPRDESNLVLRAAAALAERAGVRGFADITLDKRVPSAAGLGGGSADAAAVLEALNHLWGCGLGPEELRDVGAMVGSDVPALMMGGPAIAGGRGERVEPARVRPLALVLVRLPFAVSTPDAFRWWDQEGTTGPDPGAVMAACDPDTDTDLAELGALLFNDLEGPVLHRHPEIGRAKEILMDGGAVAALMSGSGPTVVGVLPEDFARVTPNAEQELKDLAGRPPAYVQTVLLNGDPGVGWDTRRYSNR